MCPVRACSDQAPLAVLSPSVMASRVGYSRSHPARILVACACCSTSHARQRRSGKVSRQGSRVVEFGSTDRVSAQGRAGAGCPWSAGYNPPAAPPPPPWWRKAPQERDCTRPLRPFSSAIIGASETKNHGRRTAQSDRRNPVRPAQPAIGSAEVSLTSTPSRSG